MAYLNIGNSKYEIISNKPSTDYCISIHGNGLSGYCVLTKNKPNHNRDTISVQTIDGIRYVNDPIKPMSKIRMKRAIWGDSQKGHWHSFIKFYNKSGQLIAQFTGLPNDWWSMETNVYSDIEDQSINRCHAYYYQDTHSHATVAWTCDVIDIDGISHRLFYGERFKNHGHDSNMYFGVGQRDNGRISQNNFPMELRY